MTSTPSKATAGPWEFRDGFIIANGEALKIVGVQIPAVSSASRIEAIHNARLAAAAREMLEALEKAEELYQLGIMYAPDGLFDEVQRLRRAAISRATGEA